MSEKLVTLVVSAKELQGIAVAVGSTGWKPADFPVINTLVRKIEIAAEQFKPEVADVSDKPVA